MKINSDPVLILQVAGDARLKVMQGTLDLTVSVPDRIDPILIRDRTVALPHVESVRRADIHIILMPKGLLAFVEDIIDETGEFRGTDGFREREYIEAGLHLLQDHSCFGKWNRISYR